MELSTDINIIDHNVFIGDKMKPIQQSNNPLASFMRQPKIYIRLPSGGAYWPPGSIHMPENGELPVFSMTAKDELAFKTPDALMNGQAVVDVIQSCVPNITNAWMTPNLDLDLILMAIRIASFGERMEITYDIPVINEPVSNEIDLRVVMDQVIKNTFWNETVVIHDELTCFIKPLTYQHLTKTGLSAFEAQKIMQSINDESISDERKLEIFNMSFNKMTGIATQLLVDSIEAIQIPSMVVDDKRHIREFLENSDSMVSQKIQDHINEMKTKNGIQPLIVQCTPEQIEQGAPETFEVPIGLDNANFFVRGS